jgi:spermidine synthase
MANLTFYEDARRCLRPSGVFVMNLAGEKISSFAQLDWIREVFGESVIAVPVDNESNRVVFAQKDKHFEPRWKWLLWQARRLKGLFGLEFPHYVQQFKRCYEDDVARHVKREAYASAPAPPPVAAR